MKKYGVKRIYHPTTSAEAWCGGQDKIGAKMEINYAHRYCQEMQLAFPECRYRVEERE